MELPVEQLLQQAIAAHQEGKLQDAERLYRSILQSQPDHAGVNHNLGLLAVSAGKVEEALPLFENAYKTKPNIEQFCLSYIDALIIAKQSEKAKRVLEKARIKGIADEKLSALEHRLAAMAKTRKPTSEQITEKKTTKLSTAAANDLQQQLNKLLEHYQSGQLRDAETLAISISQRYPNHGFAWKILAGIFTETGRTSRALHAHQVAIDLSPHDAEAHNSLGATLINLGRFDQAEASLKRAITLKPNFAVAHANLGATLINLGRFDQAEASLKRAITLKPDFAVAHTNLGNIFRKKGNVKGAIISYANAVATKSTPATAYASFADVIRNARFDSSVPELYTPLAKLLGAENRARPIDVAGCVLSLLSHDAQLKEILLEEASSISLKELTSTIGILNEFPILYQLMRLCPLPSLKFEQLFVSLRRLLLKNLDTLEVSPKLLYFLSTLSLQCFINEYVYFEGEDETHLVNRLEAQIQQSFEESEQPEAAQILCFAAYRPLHQYEWCQNLESLDNLEEVKRRLIDEPLSEKNIARDIATLREISDSVSLEVREQYEENPYPRWVKLHVPVEAHPVAKVCEANKLQLYSVEIETVTTPSILIAGCGTGQHAIETASRYSNCHATAVDLSLSSLAYAQRKTNELGLENLEYLQADILDLHRLGRKFDIIESVGVLHHMNEPMAGWRVLFDLLKSGGLMKIGLYSELARQPIVAVRKEITSLGLGTSEGSIRNFRRLMVESRDENHQRLTAWNDFFSLSEVRDLIFHVQEHRFTLPQIKKCLDDLGLKFCGFENPNVIKRFQEFHGKEADIYDLSLWHQYEEKKTRTFAGMYVFWCQKV